jgi:glycosyltransferase involved in cell wall biosynthesis
MTISVIIPLYNKEHHIARALDSALAQTVPPDEIIVVDDGSTDQGAQLVFGYRDPRIRLIRQRNAGVAVARNRGVEEATGELIAFLDADDAYLPAFLETIVRLRQRHSSCGAYATAYAVVDINGTLNAIQFYGVGGADWEGIVPSYFASVATGEPLVWSSAVAIPKRIFTECGGFPVGERLGEDLDCWLRIALRYPIAFSSQVCSTYYMNAENRAAQNPNTADGLCYVNTALSAIDDKMITGDDAKYLQEYASRCLLQSAIDCLYAGERAKARRHLQRCNTSLFWRRKLQLELLSMLPVSFTVYLLHGYQLLKRN